MFVFSLILVLCGVAADRPETELKAAIEEFEFGEHTKAEQKLSSLLNPIRLEAAEDVIVARQYLGACYYLLNERTKAEAEFAKILALDPEHKLDPEVFSPALVKFFQDVRTRTGLGLGFGKKEVKAEVIPEPPPAFSPPKMVSVEPAGRPPLALAFLPFGVGQFNNGSPGLGALFVGLETGLLATSLTTFVMFRGLCDRETATGACETADQTDADRAESLQTIATVTAISAAAVAVIGVVEALISHPGDGGGS